jgi:hypothetical protein
VKVILVCLLLAVPLSAQRRSLAADSTLQGGILKVVQEFGRAPYSRCHFTVYFNQPPLPRDAIFWNS